MSKRLTINSDTAYALSNALSYFLVASSENYGSGEPDPVLEAERAEVERFMERIEGLTD